jgi:hypothetical protein
MQKQMKMFSDYILNKNFDTYAKEILPTILKTMAQLPKNSQNYNDSKNGEGYMFDYKMLPNDVLVSLV